MHVTQYQCVASVFNNSSALYTLGHSNSELVRSVPDHQKCSMVILSVGVMQRFVGT